MDQSKLSVNGQEYSFHEGAVLFRDPTGQTRSISFDQPLKARFSLGGKIYFRGRDQIPVPSTDIGKKIFLEIFSKWKLRDPEAAKKGAFDYVDGQKGFVGVALGVSLLLSLPMAAGLLSDSYEQYSCSQTLRQNSILSQMEVTKFRKKRTGHYILDLRFTTPDGKVINGHDQVITESEASIPKSVPVVYSPEKPQCWSLTPGMTGSEVNWAKRRYFAVFTLLFGSFFLAVGLTGLVWSLIRLLQRRPYTPELRQLFNL